MSLVFCCLKNCFDGMGFTEPHTVRREPNPVVLDTGYMDNLACHIRKGLINSIAVAGHEVVIVKNGLRMCGSGGCLASAPLVQNKSYFEVKLQQNGVWGCGVATRSADVNTAPGGHDSESWVLCSDLCIRHNQNSLQKINTEIQEGDVIVSFTKTKKQELFLRLLQIKRSLQSSELDEAYGIQFLGHGSVQSLHWFMSCLFDGLPFDTGIWYDHLELNFSINGKPLESPVTGIKGTVYPCLYVDDGAILDIIVDNFSHQPPNGFDKIMIEQSLL